MEVYILIYQRELKNDVFYGNYKYRGSRFKSKYCMQEKQEEKEFNFV